jgi:GTP-binding protein HflX
MLVAVSPKIRAGIISPEDSLDELAQLTNSAGGTVVGRLVQSLPVPTKAYYIGKGKLAELLTLKEST